MQTISQDTPRPPCLIRFSLKHYGESVAQKKEKRMMLALRGEGKEYGEGKGGKGSEMKGEKR